MSLNLVTKGTLVGAALVAMLAVPSYAQANFQGLIAVEALGGSDWNCTNGSGLRCFNYSRGHHRLRLENTNIRKLLSYPGIVSGSFTITNRRHWRSDPHVFVKFDVSNGRVVKLKVRTDGDYYWRSAIPDEASYRGVGRADVYNVVTSLGVNGDADGIMAHSVWNVVEEYRLFSRPEPIYNTEFRGLAGKCLTVDGNIQRGTRVVLSECTGSPNQRWTYSADGEVVIRGYCLDVQWGRTENRTPLQLWTCNDTPAQAFELNDWTGEITSFLDDDKCVDVAGGRTANGTPIQLYSCNRTQAQEWEWDESAPRR